MDMEISQVKHEALDESMHKLTVQEEEEEEEGPPHEALFLVLAYLPLFELLSMSEVCKPLRNAVTKDVLPWLNIIVERPLNWRLSDEILMKITSKAIGRLKTLGLMNCVKITDDGFHRVIEKNPRINQLYIPACTGLTPEGVIRAVKTLSEHHRSSLKSLRINGIYNIKKEHLETLRHYLQMNLQNHEQEQQTERPILFHEYRNFDQMFRNEERDRMIDMDICRKCNDVRMVFDCPRETCKRKTEVSGCKGCNLCIPRCEECGGCLESEELEETACRDNLCSECWLHLPKCNFCNKPYCKQHANQQYTFSSSSGFVCDVCHDKFIRNSSDNVQ